MHPSLKCYDRNDHNTFPFKHPAKETQTTKYPRSEISMLFGAGKTKTTKTPTNVDKAIKKAILINNPKKKKKSK